MTSEPASFLTLPSELRNAIYLYIFDSALSDSLPLLSPAPNPIAKQLKFDNLTTYLTASFHNAQSSRKLAVLRVCKQVHNEASLLALSLTPFHVSGDCSYPDLFDLRSRPLSAVKIGALRHLTLTARISHLRALNEAWAGLPFGHPSLSLETLTIVPKKPETYSTAYAEVADLSQSHTLAYIFAETFKGLRNVQTVEVRNEGCFNEVVWRLVYRSLVYRMWRWGGERCGVRFECPSDSAVIVEEDRWFKVHLHACKDDRRGSEVGEEVIRLVGGNAQDVEANVPALGP